MPVFAYILPIRSVKQTGQLVFGEFLRRTGWKLFLGPRFLWGSSLVTARPGKVETTPLPPDLGLDTTLTALGFRVDRDTRPNRFYPIEGTVLDFTADFYRQGLGSKYSFESYKFTFNKYWGLTPNQVLRSGSFARLTGGQPPFYGNRIYGTNSQLRGYTAGRYLSQSLHVCPRSWNIGWPYPRGSALWGLAAWEK